MPSASVASADGSAFLPFLREPASLAVLLEGKMLNPLAFTVVAALAAAMVFMGERFSEKEGHLRCYLLILS